MYTKEQIEEIRKRLGLLGVKDTQFSPASTIDGTEVLALVQSGENRLIRVDKLCEELARFIMVRTAQSDWAQEHEDAPSYIWHKPYIPVRTSDLINDSLQEKLISGTNIKTINNKSILGGGNLTVGGGTVVAVNDVEPDENGVVWLEADDVHALPDNTEFQAPLDTQASYSNIGSSTKVPVITTNEYGQVTHIDEVDIEGVDIDNKANKVSSGDVNGHLAALTQDGDLQDSGIGVESLLNALDSFATWGETLQHYGIIDGATTGDIANLQDQINQLFALLTGITMTATPRTTPTYGTQVTTDIVVDVTRTIDSIKIYRGSTEIYSNTTPGATTHFTYPDTYTPNTIDTTNHKPNPISYRAVVVIGGESKERTIDIEVNKIPVTLSWSQDRFVAYIGKTNTYPTLSVSGVSGQTIYYSTEPTGFVTLDANGEPTNLTSSDNGKSGRIIATYRGDDTHATATASYALQISNDSVLSIEWQGGVEPLSIPAGGQGTFIKGQVLAYYASDPYTGVDVTNQTTFTCLINGSSANAGSISGTTYNAPSITGTATIRASYGGAADTCPNITITAAVAYIGAGTSAQAVATLTNATTDYGSGTVTYNDIIVANNNDYIYILLPNGTPFVDIYSAGQPAWYEQLSNTTVNNVTYNVRRTAPLSADTYSIDIKYTN